MWISKKERTSLLKYYIVSNANELAKKEMI